MGSLLALSDPCPSRQMPPTRADAVPALPQPHRHLSAFVAQPVTPACSPQLSRSAAAAAARPGHAGSCSRSPGGSSAPAPDPPIMGFSGLAPSRGGRASEPGAACGQITSSRHLPPAITLIDGGKSRACALRRGAPGAAHPCARASTRRCDCAARAQLGRHYAARRAEGCPGDSASPRASAPGGGSARPRAHEPTGPRGRPNPHGMRL